MKLLFDQNLSRHPVGMLALEYPRVATSPTSASTRQRTKRSGPSRGSTTSSSSRRSLTSGSSRFCTVDHPKAIWVRLGSVSTIEIYDFLREKDDEIDRFVASADEALLVLH
jgi:hypothetical protein